MRLNPEFDLESVSAVRHSSYSKIPVRPFRVRMWPASFNAPAIRQNVALLMSHATITSTWRSATLSPERMLTAMYASMSFSLGLSPCMPNTAST